MNRNRLGHKYICFQCNCKFYDLKKAQPICPKCGANQNEAAHENRRRRSKKDKVLPVGG